MSFLDRFRGENPDKKTNENERESSSQMSRRKFLTEAGAGLIAAYGAQKILEPKEANAQGIIGRVGDALARKKETEARAQRESDEVFVRRVDALARSVHQDFDDIEGNFDSVIMKHERRFQENKNAKLTDNDLEIFGEGLTSLNESFENLIKLTGKTGPASNQGKLPADKTEKIGIFAGIVFPGLSTAGYGSMASKEEKESSARWARSGASQIGISVLERGKSTISRLERQINNSSVFDNDTQSRETIGKVIKVLSSMRRIASGYLSNELGNTNPTLEQTPKDDNSSRTNKSIDDLRKIRFP